METEAVVPDVFNPNCGSRRVLALIADRWTALVIYALARGSMRFGQLQRELGITQKVLTQTLRELELNGLITRTVYPVIPPKVEYTLTELGCTLIGPLSAICRWAEAYLPEVDVARSRQAVIQQEGEREGAKD